MCEYIWNYMNDNEQNRKFKEEAEKPHIRTYRLSVECYENAIALPWKSGPGWGMGGLVCDGLFVEKSMKLPKENVSSKFGGGYLVKDVLESDCKVVYAGPFYAHWGHLLVDCLLRLWFILENKSFFEDKKILFIPVNNSEFDQKFYDVLELLGIGQEKIITIDKPTKFRKVYLPEESYIVGEYWTYEYKRMFEKIINEVMKNYTGQTYDKVYLTRTKWKLGRQNGEFGEKEIEKLFAVNGYNVISPQDLGVREQIAILANCKSIACPMGTVAHAVALFGMNLQEMIICNKRCLHVPHQMYLNEMSSAQVTYIDDYYSETPGIYWIGINENMERYAKDMGFAFPYTKAFLVRKYIENGIRYYIKLCMVPVYRLMAAARNKILTFGWFLKYESKMY